MLTKVTPLIVTTIALAPAAWATAPGSRTAEPRSRTVQLIAMEPGDQPSANAASRPDGAISPVDAGPSRDAFRVHDLRRRWIEHQMSTSLIPPPATDEGLRSSDPIALQSSDSPSVVSVDFRPLAPSSIVVPAWMRGTGFTLGADARFAPVCDRTPYRPSGFLKLDTEARRQSHYAMMSAVACQYGLPVGLFDSMIIRESRYQPAALSPKNAFGLTQLMPGTAADLGVNRYDVEQNLRGGARYLRRQLDRFGHYHLALAAYNAGPGRVRGSVPAIPETLAYVDNVLQNWSRLTGLQRRVTIQTASSIASGQRTPLARNATLLSF